MQNYRLKIVYDGTRYAGWEHQPGQETIQGKLEQVLARMCSLDMKPGDFMKPDTPIKLIAAGRTDAGVHARGMIASIAFDAPAYRTGSWERRQDHSDGRNNQHRKMTCQEMQDYLNHYLPDDISIAGFKEAAPRFHARYKAVGKTYQYTAFDGRVKPVFNRRYYTPLEQELDVASMQRAAEYLLGEHDFKSFCGNSRMKKSTVRTVDRIEIRRSKGYVYFTFHGTGFLQNMVRILVGTLMEVGWHRMNPQDMEKVLEAKDRRAAGPTAPARGLCLIRVDYD